MNQNKKQTAVEWLIYSLDSLEQKNIDNEITLCDYIDQKNNLQEQAKAMEKEQNRDSFYNGFHKGYNVGQNDIQSHPLTLTIANHIHSDYEQYYKETYGE